MHRCARGVFDRHTPPAPLQLNRNQPNKKGCETPARVPISPKMTSGLVGLQVCEVSVDIINSIDGRMHTIRCEMVPDSGRVYRLDGRLRSGKEVKVSHAQPSHDYRDQLLCKLPTLAHNRLPYGLSCRRS
jgi:hypothetical protein